MPPPQNRRMRPAKTATAFKVLPVLAPDRLLIMSPKAANGILTQLSQPSIGMKPTMNSNMATMPHKAEINFIKKIECRH